MTDVSKREGLRQTSNAVERTEFSSLEIKEREQGLPEDKRALSPDDRAPKSRGSHPESLLPRWVASRAPPGRNDEELPEKPVRDLVYVGLTRVKGRGDR